MTQVVLQQVRSIGFAVLGDEVQFKDLFSLVRFE